MAKVPPRLVAMEAVPPPVAIARTGIGLNSAVQGLLTVGATPRGLNSEASFAASCGARPVPVSSDKTLRHGLIRGGIRATKNAPHMLAGRKTALLTLTMHRMLTF
ncbi:transposase IS116/IS110/IS902 family protein [Rhodovulum sulfidophilum]|uniref:Transposase IS116/IS110/IS902 family protein n=1 Tax=Rhodovulum sulfidophilum TaxID=35806 RepID=A0A0D6B963_RHOSU|nr:transposase IS116/IS110/IS902 family protein [Rhodovulum sulfidophilum]